jgi:mRNA-degrading endonuclease toxin of MazEF toxin-antitoxin module
VQVSLDYQGPLVTDGRQDLFAGFGSSRGSAPAERHPGDTGLSKPSVVNISQLYTVDKSELDERIGKLSADAVQAIRKGLGLLLDIT